MAQQGLDAAKAEEFAGRMVGLMNDAMLSLMISIGHRTELFDKMANLPPSTSQEIATAAGLNERYVREWLGAMATGRIAEYNPDNSKYSLPPERASLLTRAAGVDNLAMYTQYISQLGNIEPKIVECFRHGGGVPYSFYPEFQRLQDEESNRVYDASLINSVLPLVPGLSQRLNGGIEVADIGCGSGHAINVMAKAFPQSGFTGYDFSEEGINAGRLEAQKMGLDNAHFEAKDVATLSDSNRYDFITAFDTIHDQAQPARVLQAISTALKPAGVFLMVDIAASSNVHENMENPFAPMLYAISCMHCMTVSLALEGEGLGTMWGRQKAEQMLTEAGFTLVDVKQVEGDIFNHYYIATKG